MSVSEEAKMLEKPAPAKGQCWKTNGSPSVIEEVVGTSPMPSCRLRGHSSTTPHVHYTKVGWDYISTLMTSDDYAFLGGPSPVSDGGGRDWSAWLPRRALPRDKSLTYKAGQVWAVGHLVDEDLYASVFHVDRVGKSFGGMPADNHHMDVSVLAGKGSGGFSNRDYTERAVLVADVGCEPTPPEVLYGTADGDEGAMVENGMRLSRWLGLAERALERIASDWKPGRRGDRVSCDPYTVASAALKGIRRQSR